jgi:hypothetical protein
MNFAMSQLELENVIEFIFQTDVTIVSMFGFQGIVMGVQIALVASI